MSPIRWPKKDDLGDLTRRLGPSKSPGDAEEASKAKDATPAPDPSATALSLLRKAIEQGHAPAALALYQKGQWGPENGPAEWDFLKLIKLLQTEKMIAESVPIMERFIEIFPERASAVRLKLAQVLIRDQKRPVQALRVLSGIAEGSLPPTLEPGRQRLEEAATRMRDEGVLELEGDSW